MKRYIMHVIVSSTNLSKGFDIKSDPDLSNAGIKRILTSNLRRGAGLFTSFLISIAATKSTGESGVMLSRDTRKQTISEHQNEEKGNYLSIKSNGISEFKKDDSLKNTLHQNTSNMTLNYSILSINQYDSETNRLENSYRALSTAEVMESNLTGTKNSNLQDLYFVLPENMDIKTALTLDRFFMADNPSTTSNILVLSDRCYPTAALARRAVQSEAVKQKLDRNESSVKEKEDDIEMQSVKRPPPRQ